jgi:hypothetical protein
MRDPMRLGAGDVGPVEQNPTGGRAQQADQRLHRGALAGAVAAKQNQHLAFLHLEREIMQHMRAAVERIDTIHAQHHGSPPR